MKLFRYLGSYRPLALFFLLAVLAIVSAVLFTKTEWYNEVKTSALTALVGSSSEQQNREIITEGAWTAYPLPIISPETGPGGPHSYKGDAKHLRFTMSPERVYEIGGDYGTGVEYSGSSQQRIWSIDGADLTAGWRMEQPFCVPDGQVQPGGVDEYATAWDSKRGVIWGMGGGQPFPNPCPGEENLSGHIVYFDPDTGRWTDTGVIRPYGNGTVAVYDAAKDKIWSFGYDGRGQVAHIFDLETLTWRTITLATNNAGELINNNNSRLTHSSMAFDPEKRRIWTVDPAAGKLMYLDMDAEELVMVEDTWPHTTHAAGSGMLFFDRDTGVLHYFDEKDLSGGWFDYYTYDTNTNVLERQVLPNGFTPRGNSGFYDSYHDKILVMGSAFFEKGEEPTHFYVLDLSKLDSSTSSNNQMGSTEGTFSWEYMNPTPSLRYAAIWSNQPATFALTPEDRIETREPWFREYSFPVAAEGKILSFGGAHGGYAGNEVVVYDISENIWNQLRKPVVPPSGDPMYGSGGSPNVYVDPVTGEWQPYTIHGYGRISYLPPENMIIATIVSCVQVVQSADGYVCGDKSMYLSGFDLDDLQWHILGGPLTANAFMSAGSLSEYDPINNAVYIFGGYFNTMVWRYRDGVVTRIANLPLHVGGGSGHSGAASTYISPLNKHLVAEMPQGGGPPAGLYLVDFEDAQAEKIDVPSEIVSRFGPNGNFYFDYNDQIGKIVVLQGTDIAGESYITLYDPATNIWGETQHLTSGPLVRTEGATNRKPLLYDAQTGRMFYVNYNSKDGVETWELVVGEGGSSQSTDSPSFTNDDNSTADTSTSGSEGGSSGGSSDQSSSGEESSESDSESSNSGTSSESSDTDSSSSGESSSESGDSSSSESSSSGGNNSSSGESYSSDSDSGGSSSGGSSSSSSGGSSSGSSSSREESTSSELRQTIVSIIHEYRDLFIRANNAGIPLPQVIYDMLDIVPANSGISAQVRTSGASCPRFNFTRTLRYDDTGMDVRALQQFLNCAGFTIAKSGSGSPGNETVYFGLLTKNAVIRFQEAYAKEVLVPVDLVRGSGIFGTHSQKTAERLMR